MRHSKIKVLMKLTAILTLIIFPLQSFASEPGIFANLSGARVLASELNFYKKNKEENEFIIKTLEDESSQYLKLSNEYEKKIILMDQDKTILRTRGDKFEDAFMSTSKALVQCKDEKPSRFVWFGVGVVSTVLLGLTGIYLIKK